MSDKKIFKYTIGSVERQTIQMPVNARILCVQNQRGNVCLWAEVAGVAYEDRTFWIIGTGFLMPVIELIYIGTIQDDELVWHIYEEV